MNDDAFDEAGLDAARAQSFGSPSCGARPPRRRCSCCPALNPTCSCGGARGNWVRKITIKVPPDWLEDGQLGAVDQLRRFGRTHGASARWTPSARQLQLAERMVGPAPYGAQLEALCFESHALEIVADTLPRLADPDGAPSPRTG